MLAQVSKTRALFELLHTGGEETTGEENEVTARFQAVLADFDPVGDPVATGDDYYLTAAFSFAGGEYVWVGQRKVTTRLLEAHVSGGAD